ncbi:MAG: cyclic nucleotide-binding domain-containing protein [Desulfovibrionales bacterium]
MSTTAEPSSGRPNIVTFTRGEEIFAQDAPAEHVYIVVSGKVSLWRNGMWLTALSSHSILGVEGLYNRTAAFAYTAKAETLCRLAKYPINEFMDSVYQTPRLAELTFSSMARQLELGWEKVSRGDRQDEQVFFAGDIRTYEAGETVIGEGEESTDIYRIISTELGVEVSKGGHVLAVLNEPGEIFGEMAAVLKEKRTASVRSIGKSVLEVYPPQQLLDVLSDYSDLSLRIIRSLSRRLAETSRVLTEVKEGSRG